MLPNGTHFVTAGRDGRAILWGLDGFKKVKEYRGPEGAWRVASSPDGRTLFMVQKGAMQRLDLPALPK
jgi:WD40 repeat protein